MLRVHTKHLGLLGVLVCCSSTFTPHAHAAGFAVDRFEPAERGSDWFANESLDLRGDGHFVAGGTFDFAHEPLVAYDGDEPRARLISRQLFLHLGTAVVLSERFRLGLSLPVLLDSAGEAVDTGTGTLSPPDGAGLGDLRLGFDVRLLGEHGDAATLAIGAWGYLPHGSTGNFASDGSTRVQPRLAFAGRAGSFEYAAKSGVNLRTTSADFAGEPFGTEWQFGLAAGARVLDDQLLIGPELWGSTVLVDSGAFARETTPVEAVLGGHYRVADWSIGLAAGPGITRGLGTPTLRALLSVDYAPLPEPEFEPEAEAPIADSDGDGILDDIDACPTDPGVKSEDLKTHGCPLPDADGDAIADADDACADVPGVASEDRARHGCPSDRDGDGFLDEGDACPDEAGIANDDAARHGCPLPPDRDADGIIDDEDACDDQPGPRREPAEKNGCPIAQLTASKVEINERIEFDTGKATLRPESEQVLEAVRQVLEAHPEITQLRIEGHTDDLGGVWANTRLSQRRAAAVLEWLTNHGIEPERLRAEGFGPKRPIDDNRSETGRQNNRRVEFQIERRDPSKATSQETAR